MTVQSKIIYQLKRECLLSKHIKFKSFRQLTPGDVKYPIKHPKWTKISVPASQQQIIQLNGLFIAPWKCKFQKQFTMTAFYGAVTILLFFSSGEKKKHARYKNLVTCGHLLYKFHFILDGDEGGMETATARSKRFLFVNDFANHFWKSHATRKGKVPTIQQ